MLKFKKKGNFYRVYNSNRKLGEIHWSWKYFGLSIDFRCEHLVFIQIGFLELIYENKS